MSHNLPPSGGGPDNRPQGGRPGGVPTPPWPGQGPSGAPQPGTPPYGGAQYGARPPYGTTPPPGGSLYGAPQYGGLPPAPSGPKGLAIAALACGIFAFVTAWIPVVNVAALIAGLAAVVLGIVALVKKTGGQVMAWFGTVLGLLGLLGALLMMFIFATLTATVARGPLSEPLKDYNADRNKEVSVQYVITTATPANVRYSTPTGSSELVVTKDTTQEFKAQAKDYLRISIDSSDSRETGAKVGCEILIDGQSVAKETGEGKSASSSCYYSKSFSRYSSEAPAKDVAVEFKVTANGKATATSRWSASGGSNSSTRYVELDKNTTSTVQAKDDGTISLTVRGTDFEAANPNFGCEILVDGKSVSKQQSTTAYGSARCTYSPVG